MTINWDMADCLPVAPPHPNRLAALHNNTMGNGPHVWFDRNQLWGQVIVGDLMKLLNTIFVTHDYQLGYGRLLCLWHRSPQKAWQRFIQTPWVMPPTFGLVGIDGGGE